MYDNKNIVSKSEDCSVFKARIDGSLTDVTSEMLQWITSIGSSAFNNCTSLASITIPNSVTSIGQSAFNNCTSLTSVTIPNSVTSIGSSAFYYCTSLTSVEIPNSVTSILNSAFSNCTSLASITIPNSVTNIGSYAFYNCRSLTSVEIPNSVTSIGGSAFNNCTSLTSVTVKATTPPTLGSNVFYGTNINLVIYVPAESVDAYKSASGWSNYSGTIQAIPSEQLGGGVD